MQSMWVDGVDLVKPGIGNHGLKLGYISGRLSVYNHQSKSID